MKLQQNLFAESGDFVAGLHNRSKQKKIYTAQAYDDPDHGNWHQRGCDYKTAIQTANNWQTYQAKDCYVSANGFGWEKGGRRSVSSVTSLNCFYVDFDRYKTEEYGELSPDDFLTVILDENPWLPTPSVYIDSGNGCWAIWSFKRPPSLPSDYDWLVQWQTQQDFLIRKLARYGADPACADAARVIRCAGTINSKTERIARAWETGEKYDFKTLKQAFNQEHLKDAPAKDHDQLTPNQKPSRKRFRPTLKHKGVSHIFNEYTLSAARMWDFRNLADMRGGLLTECRKRVIWYYACAAAHYCKTEDTLRAEVESFISDCIANPGRYMSGKKAVNYESTVDRMNAEMRLINLGQSRKKARQELGKNKARYWLTNAKLIEELRITPEEQRSLKTIIGKDEKNRRATIAKREKRRANGVMARADYLSRSEQRKLEAKELYQKLKSVRSVASVMGMSVGMVHRYLS